MARKTIDKEGTIQNIIEWSNRSAFNSIDLAGVRKKADASGGQKFLREAAEFCGVEIVYHN